MYACVCEDGFSRPLVVVRGGVQAAWHRDIQPKGGNEGRESDHCRKGSFTPKQSTTCASSFGPVSASSSLQSTLVAVELESSQHLKGPLLLEPTHRFQDESGELQFDNALVQPTDSRAKVLISNPTGITQKLKEGMWVGRASEAEMIVGDSLEVPSEEPAQSICEDEPTCVNTVATENVEDRKYKLAEAIKEEGADLPWQERSKLHTLLLKHHQAFCLEEGERGETDLVELKIDTRDAHQAAGT